MQATVTMEWMIEQAIRTAKLRLCCLDGGGGIHADDALRIVIEELVTFDLIDSEYLSLYLSLVSDDDEEKPDAEPTVTEAVKE